MKARYTLGLDYSANSVGAVIVLQGRGGFEQIES